MVQPAENEDGLTINDFEPVPQDILDLLPVGLVRRNLVVPLAKRDDRLLVGIPDMDHVVKPEGLSVVAGCPVDTLRVPLPDIQKFISRHYLSEPVQEMRVVRPKYTAGQRPAVLAGHPFGAAFSQLVQAAMGAKASEVLVDIQNETVLIRFRVHGGLAPSNEFKRWDRERAQELFSAIKEKCETRVSQGFQWTDWRGVLKGERDEYRCHVLLSETETVHMLTIRFAQKQEAAYDPHRWNMDIISLKKFEKLLMAKKGLVLFASDAGIPVDDVFYGVLKRSQTSERRLVLVEEQSGETISGVDKIEVGESQDLMTVANYLFQHRPDVMAIRPLKSHDLIRRSFEEALQGNLILARCYASDTATLIYELLHSGVEPYLIGTALQGIVVQQPLRLLCTHCQEKDLAAHHLIRDLNIPPALRPAYFYQGTGCEQCLHTGFDKEVNLFEIFDQTDDIEDVLYKNSSVEEIRTHLFKIGFKTFRTNALRKAINGQTSLTEVLRVTS